MIVRQDLPRGLQAAQIIHAAGESSPGNLPDGTYAIALTVPAEPDLLELAEHLATRGVNYKLIRESRAPYSDQAMAIGIVPGPRLELRQHFSSLPLVK